MNSRAAHGIYYKAKSQLASFYATFVAFEDALNIDDRHLLDPIRSSVTKAAMLEAEIDAELDTKLIKIKSQEVIDLCYVAAAAKLSQIYNDFNNQRSFKLTLSTLFDKLIINYYLFLVAKVNEVNSFQDQLAAIESKAPEAQLINNLKNQINISQKDIDGVNDKVIPLFTWLQLVLDEKKKTLTTSVEHSQILAMQVDILYQNYLRLNIPNDEFEKIAKLNGELKDRLTLLSSNLNAFAKLLAEVKVEDFFVKQRINDEGKRVHDINPVVNNALLAAYFESVLKYYRDTGDKDLLNKFPLMKYEKQLLFKFDGNDLELNNKLINEMSITKSTASILYSINQSFSAKTSSYLVKEFNSRLRIDEFKVVETGKGLTLRCLEPGVLVVPMNPPRRDMNQLLAIVLSLQTDLSALQNELQQNASTAASLTENITDQRDDIFEAAKAEAIKNFVDDTKALLHYKKLIMQQSTLFSVSEPAWVNKLIKAMSKNISAVDTLKKFIKIAEKEVNPEPSSTKELYNLIIASQQILASRNMEDLNIVKSTMIDEMHKVVSKLPKINIEDFVNIDTRQVSESTLFNPIAQAIKEGTPAQVAALLNATNINVKIGGETPLCIAVREGGYDLVEHLLNNGADINLVNERNGYTPLMIAIEERKPKLVRLLIERGADLNAVSKDGMQALDLARSKNDKEIYKLVNDAVMMDFQDITIKPNKP